MKDRAWASALGRAERYAGTVVTMGTFDGVHVGHQAVISRAVDESRRLGVRSIALTFDPHPRAVIARRGSDDPPSLLTTTRERVALLSSLGLDEVVVIRFDDELADMTAEDFVDRVLVERFSVRSLVVGYDHAFGKDRKGRPEVVAEMGRTRGFETIPVGPATCDGFPVKSGRVRRLLEEGRVDEAARLLGRPYRLVGRVQRGAGRGWKLGYPTVNVAVPPEKVLPRAGVMAARVGVDPDDSGARADAWFGAMAYVGSSPTFGGERVGVEAHLFDFDGDLMGRELSIELIARTRDDAKFERVDALISAIKRDEATCRAILAGLQKN